MSMKDSEQEKNVHSIYFIGNEKPYFQFSSFSLDKCGMYVMQKASTTVFFYVKSILFIKTMNSEHKN